MELHYALVSFLLRVFLGFLFLFQGYDKLFRLGIQNVYNTVESKLFERLPKSIAISGLYLSSFVEFLGGLLLVVGLFKNIALYMIGLDLLIVSISFGILNPMWDMKFVWPRLILVSALLLMPDAWDQYSADNLLSFINVVKE